MLDRHEADVVSKLRVVFEDGGSLLGNLHQSLVVAPSVPCQEWISSPGFVGNMLAHIIT